MDTYVMKKDLFIELVRKASKRSSMYTFADILDEESENLDIRAVSHRGFFAIINDFNAYYQANMSLVDLNNAGSLFDKDWPIYTHTNDSCPTQYFEGSKVTSSVVSNGCLIEGTVENSIMCYQIRRYCKELYHICRCCYRKRRSCGKSRRR